MTTVPVLGQPAAASPAAPSRGRAGLNRTVSVEALLRWRHPLFGDASPTGFVPLAEESPLITDIGRWVLRNASAAGAWSAAAVRVVAS